MKNYEETIETVFTRISQHRAAQKCRKQLAVRLSASVCCVCLLGIACFGLMKYGYTVPKPTVEDAVHPGIADYTEPSQQPPKPVKENKIIINQLAYDPEDRGIMNIALHIDDFIPMTVAELTDYYGINIKPEVPADIPERKQNYGIFKRNGGTGEIYWDTTKLTYSNEDNSRSLSLMIDKGQMPLLDYGVIGLELNEGESLSLINGTEVMIGLSKNGYYAAEFMYKDVGFWIIAEGLTESEFVSIIESLIV